MKYKSTKYLGIYSYSTKSGERYRARVFYLENGKQEEISKSGFKTLAEARAFKSNIESKIDADQIGLVTGRGRTFGEQWKAYSTRKINNGILSLGTLSTNSHRIKPWLKVFEHTRLKDITKNDVQDRINILYKENNYSEATMKGFFKLFMQVIDDAVDDEVLARNKYKRVTYATPNDDYRPKEKIVELEVFKKFMKVAEENLREDIFRCLYLVTFGLRRSEVYGIQKDAITFLDGGIARIEIKCARTKEYPEGHKVKTKDSYRFIIVDERATEMLKQQIEYAKSIKMIHSKILHEEDFIFLTPETGKPYYISLLNDNMNTISKKIDSELRLTPHMLRHMFATYASAFGADSLQLRNYLRHSDEDMTSHYTMGTDQAATNIMRLTQAYRD